MESTLDEASSELTVIGWRERVDLPDWSLAGLRAKADTGARSSALDVSELEELNDELVRFHVLFKGPDGVAERVIEAPIVRHTHVRSSFGRRARRIFVETTVRIAGQEFRTEIGLVDRSKMLCRMLIGRQTLRDRFVVDSAHTHLHGKARRLPRPTDAHK